MSLDVIYEDKHRRGCWAPAHIAAGKADRVWIVDQVVRRSATGRRHPRALYRWVRFRCNCIDCPAKMLSPESELGALVARGGR